MVLYPADNYLYVSVIHMIPGVNTIYLITSYCHVAENEMFTLCKLTPPA